MQDCIFCRIAQGQLPSEFIYESDSVIAFRDIQPAAPIHILIVPKEHLENINAVKESHKELLYNIHHAIQEVAKKLNVYETGYRVITNCGKGAGQSVFHLHYHILAGQEMGQLLP